MKNKFHRYDSGKKMGYYTHTPHHEEMTEEVLMVQFSNGDELRMYEENGMFRIKGDADEVISFPFSDLPKLISNLTRFLTGNTNHTNQQI